jgi:hypothetical protein
MHSNAAESLFKKDAATDEQSENRRRFWKLTDVFIADAEDLMHDPNSYNG